MAIKQFKGTVEERHILRLLMDRIKAKGLIKSLIEDSPKRGILYWELTSKNGVVKIEVELDTEIPIEGQHKQRPVIIRGQIYTGAVCPIGMEYCWECGHIALPEAFIQSGCPNPDCPDPSNWND